jgi:hypothetical protein
MRTGPWTLHDWLALLILLSFAHTHTCRLFLAGTLRVLFGGRDPINPTLTAQTYQRLSPPPVVFMDG